MRVSLIFHIFVCIVSSDISFPSPSSCRHCQGYNNIEMVVFDAAVIQGLQNQFENIAFRVFRNGQRPSNSPRVHNVRMRSWFGCSSTTIAQTWHLITHGQPPLENGASQEHLLWALALMKSYVTEMNHASRCGGVDEKTATKWSWYFIRQIAYLCPLLIRWENRLKNDIGNDCLISIDGVDFWRENEILWNGRPNPDYYSHKFKMSGMRGEIGLAIRGPDICWKNGLFPCGQYPDINIFRAPDGLRELLHEENNGERVEADDGYVGDNPLYCKTPASVFSRPDQERLRGRVRMRHEHVNKRIKNFSCMVQRFRHSIQAQNNCFDAAIVLSQLAIENGEELLSLPEYDDRLSDAQVLALHGV